MVIEIPSYFPDEVTRWVIGHIPDGARDGNLEATRRVADAFARSARRLTGTLHRLEQQRRDALEWAIEGETGAAIREGVDRQIAATRAQLDANTAVAQFLYEAANTLEVLVYEVISIACALVVSWLWCAASPGTALAAKLRADVEAGLVRRRALTWLMQRWTRFAEAFPKLANSAGAVVAGASTMGGVQVAAQSMQIAAGDGRPGSRTSLDWGRVGSAAAIGGVGGVAGVLAGRWLLPRITDTGVPARLVAPVTGAVAGASGGAAATLAMPMFGGDAIQPKTLAEMMIMGAAGGLVVSTAAAFRVPSTAQADGTPSPWATPDSVSRRGVSRDDLMPGGGEPDTPGARAAKSDAGDGHTSKPELSAELADLGREIAREFTRNARFDDLPPHARHGAAEFINEHADATANGKQRIETVDPRQLRERADAEAMQVLAEMSGPEAPPPNAPPGGQSSPSGGARPVSGRGPGWRGWDLVFDHFRAQGADLTAPMSGHSALGGRTPGTAAGHGENRAAQLSLAGVLVDAARIDGGVGVRSGPDAEPGLTSTNAHSPQVDTHTATVTDVSTRTPDSSPQPGAASVPSSAPPGGSDAHVHRGISTSDTSEPPPGHPLNHPFVDILGSSTDRPGSGTFASQPGLGTHSAPTSAEPPQPVRSSPVTASATPDVVQTPSTMPRFPVPPSAAGAPPATSGRENQPADRDPESHSDLPATGTDDDVARRDPEEWRSPNEITTIADLPAPGYIPVPSNPPVPEFPTATPEEHSQPPRTTYVIPGTPNSSDEPPPNTIPVVPHLPSAASTEADALPPAYRPPIDIPDTAVPHSANDEAGRHAPPPEVSPHPRPSAAPATHLSASPFPIPAEMPPISHYAIQPGPDTPGAPHDPTTRPFLYADSLGYIPDQRGIPSPNELPPWQLARAPGPVVPARPTPWAKASDISAESGGPRRRKQQAPAPPEQNPRIARAAADDAFAAWSQGLRDRGVDTDKMLSELASIFDYLRHDPMWEFDPRGHYDAGIVLGSPYIGTAAVAANYFPADIPVVFTGWSGNEESRPGSTEDDQVHRTLDELRINSEAKRFRLAAEKLGLNSGRSIEEPFAENTRQNASKSVAILERHGYSVASLVVACKQEHARRVYLTFRKQTPWVGNLSIITADVSVENNLRYEVRSDSSEKGRDQIAVDILLEIRGLVQSPGKGHIIGQRIPADILKNYHLLSSVFPEVNERDVRMLVEAELGKGASAEAAISAVVEYARHQVTDILTKNGWEGLARLSDRHPVHWASALSGWAASQYGHWPAILESANGLDWALAIDSLDEEARARVGRLLVRYLYGGQIEHELIAEAEPALRRIADLMMSERNSPKQDRGGDRGPAPDQVTAPVMRPLPVPISAGPTTPWTPSELSKQEPADAAPAVAGNRHNLLEFKRDHLYHTDRPHLFVESEDGLATFIAPFHLHDPLDGRSLALLSAAEQWFDRTVGMPRAVKLEGLVVGRQEAVPWASIDEAFRSQRGEIGAIAYMAKSQGVKVEGLEEPLADTGAGLVAAGHGIDAIYVYAVTRMQRQGLQSGRDPREVLEEAARGQARRFFPNYTGDDPVGWFRQAFHQLCPDWPLGDGFRNDQDDIDRLLDMTGSAPPAEGTVIHPVKAVALACHERRRIFAAEEINISIDAGNAVLVIMGDRHLDPIAGLVPQWRNRPVFILDAGSPPQGPAIR
ncbi:ElyC/SanA/YdcF family protein [Nocardia pneumoniae]|uniref:ElyC/SanA/YdcF family protein n=1 Tax=Nocardia pneumoniae TaxID=228601 RepID=UPI00031E2779|nr:ElyC/SanA/YdcF family protein [Nocardia pneumoniae]